MGMSTGGGGRGRGRYRAMSEINVTPLVDVMLVLLIIFMVAAPLMTVGVPIDLPKTNAQALNQETEPLTISVNAEGRIFLQETEVPLEGLVPQLQAIMREQRPGAPERRIFVRGDRGINYGRVMEVMGTVSSAGFTRVALLAEQPSGAPARGAAPAQGAARPGQQQQPQQQPVPLTPRR
ncbi:protein TolR [Pseudoroseomonas cervicalis]|uniref:protein TolR n=1 Tax=Teichococcus cervicalis TaxID=204525 RepID=UPI002784FF45|nr:protein TolR [Pseudoroseomonas cervicalis]MDQ1078824.1 biopolymer transport protein TolR [Pseudoroseomonas cervicalis]